MILVLAALIAVFLAGSVCGIFAMLVIGIHAEERRHSRPGSSSSLAGSASRRMLSTQSANARTERVKAGR
ncbi:hypothetical protein GCM10009678_28960 [Actinomadura kijaniata]|uniref:Thiol:disulfide interchange protein n=1 Tax=Actinomadura namibiensis TaxID=182080 RepID=A0A7W3QJI5_ACTNM|nr:hypothetical protein [Actinomadura namibiensis]MBA8949499.1 thiol:disulfide interchange protein [Actinomadura namibiensis]